MLICSLLATTGPIRYHGVKVSDNVIARAFRLVAISKRHCEAWHKPWQSLALSLYEIPAVAVLPRNDALGSLPLAVTAHALFLTTPPHLYIIKRAAPREECCLCKSVCRLWKLNVKTISTCQSRTYAACHNDVVVATLIKGIQAYEIKLECR